MKLVLIAFMLLISSLVLAESASMKNEDGSFKVTEASQKALKIQFLEMKGSGPWIIPKSALVKVKFSNGVYRQYEGNITFIIVKILQQKGDELVIESQDIEAGDKLAITGTHFLRMIEADLNSGVVDSCN